MAHYQPMDLYFAQYEFAVKSADMNEQNGNKKEAKKYKKAASEIWDKREKVMNKNKPVD